MLDFNNQKIFSSLLFMIIIVFTNCSPGNADTKSGERQSPTVKEGYIEVEGGRIFYEEAGSGEAIVMIHDGLVHREIYDGQFLTFAENYRVVRFDRRGYGKSPAPEKEYSIIEDLNSLFVELNIEKAAVVGMSMGGGLAIDFALEYPKKVTSLVLAGAVVSGYGYSEHMMNRGGHWTSEYRQSIDAMRQYFVDLDPYQVYPENTEVKKKVKQLIDSNTHNVNNEKHRLNKGPKRPALGVLSEIKVPALILVGEFDIPDVHAHSGAIEAGIPNATRIIIRNAGHLVPMEQPEDFNKKVMEFLKSNK
ncbi:MAG: alpha/beta hydrolase [bacterium]|nr:alpha/beta hydrolase [bacterium]